MAKIVLMMNDMVLQELTLSKERTTIGRSPKNDLVIDNPAISAEHAMISFVDNDAILEDLNSTNGTQINGQPIKKHFLQENNVIELAQYQLRYLPGVCKENPHYLKSNGETLPSGCSKVLASIKILNGPNAGAETVITKTLTTIGCPHTQVAIISRRPHGYFIAHVEGAHSTRVNKRSIGATAQALSNGDLIHLAGVQMQFVLSQ